MIAKIFSHLLGNAGEEAADHVYDELMELEEEGWVIVNLPGERKLCARGAVMCRSIVVLGSVRMQLVVRWK